MLVTAERDVRYLTGFTGEASCLIVTSTKLHLITDSRFEQEAGELKRIATIIFRKGLMAQAQTDLLDALRPRSLALQAEHLSLELRDQLAAALGVRRLRNTSGLIADLRLVKDDAEVALIRHAASIQQAALAAVLPGIRAGQTEAHIAARLEYECRVRGSEQMSFGSIVAAGPNSSRPHYRAGMSKAANAKPLLIDWGCVFGAYCSDMTRTFSLGRWSRQMREIYEIVLEAHLAGIDAVRAGVPCRDVDRAARHIIERAGYGDRFGHGLGHGIGLDIHEPPRVFKATDTPLRSGMVITIEPGIYLPGTGGVRIEDDILVTPSGGVNLCTLPKDLSWATLDG